MASRSIRPCHPNPRTHAEIAERLTTGRRPQYQELAFLALRVKRQPTQAIVGEHLSRPVRPVPTRRCL